MTGRFFQYLNDIERFFSVVRTSGFVLSPKDCERVRDWYLKGVPMRVVLEGLVQGLRSFRFRAAPGQKAPHQLSYYSHFIGAGVRRFRAAPGSHEATTGLPGSGASSRAHGSVGHAPGAASRTAPAADGPAVRWIAQLRAETDLLLEREERVEARKALERVASGLSELASRAASGLSEDAVSHELQVLDDATLAFYHTLLDDSRRQALEREAATRSSRETGLSSRAREGREKAILAALLRADLHLAELAP